VSPLFLSVIVPAHNGERVLADTLPALRRSTLDRAGWELLVVDDASTDGTAAVARAHADRIVPLAGRPRGPAYARNRGVESARGDVLVFVDADVRVAPDALARVADHFERDAALGALFGSYDDQPPAPGLVSRYRNLLHHYHHHRGAGAAETFWAGLGAVRTTIYRGVGGFDEVRYARPQIEDIELGRRIRRAGHAILLDPAVQGAHLKRWTLGQVLKTDLLHRGIPWMRLLLEEGGEGAALNVSPREKIAVALVGLGLGSFAAALILGVPALVVGAIALIVVIVMNLPLYRYLARGRGPAFGIGVVPLHLLYYVTSGLAFALGHVTHRLHGGRDARDGVAVGNQ
jgi:glycosyltransferase involved in cell wall biosynthesis